MTLGMCEREKLFAAASKKIVGLKERGNLDTRHNDDEDFMVVSVWELEAALEAAYLLGRSDRTEV